MSSRKKKFYVVWEGTVPGVYSNWAECESSIKGFAGAKYKSFPTLESAEAAYQEGPGDYWGTNKFVSALSDEQIAAIGEPISHSLCVDAAWNSATKDM
ncbi:MAG: RNase H1/viroplasmin domain-containing protein, partial [Pirellulales bacterium]|nr:RNase H1/viroplasmin domain-containing protein [Pirellulales bacterium]